MNCRKNSTTDCVSTNRAWNGTLTQVSSSYSAKQSLTDP